MRMSKAIALVTGANKGIGLEVCCQLAMKHDFRVILTARDAKKGKQAAKKLQAQGLDVQFERLDVSNVKSIQKLAKKFMKQKMILDVLVNNAGVYLEGEKNLLTVKEKDMIQTLETNVIGVIRTAQAFFPLLEKSSHPRIVNVSSRTGSFYKPHDYDAVYAASKAAVNMLTVQMAGQWPKFIVSSASPGWVRTDMGGKEAPRSIEQGADTIVWLATQQNIPSGKFWHDRKIIQW